MTLDNRITHLEDKHGAPRPRPIVAIVIPDQEPDPPNRFKSREALEAWFSEEGRERPVVVIFPPKSEREE